MTIASAPSLAAVLMIDCAGSSPPTDRSCRLATPRRCARVFTAARICSESRSKALPILRLAPPNRRTSLSERLPPTVTIDNSPPNAFAIFAAMSIARFAAFEPSVATMMCRIVQPRVHYPQPDRGLSPAALTKSHHAMSIAFSEAYKCRAEPTVSSRKGTEKQTSLSIFPVPPTLRATLIERWRPELAHPPRIRRWRGGTARAIMVSALGVQKQA